MSNENIQLIKKALREKQVERRFHKYLLTPDSVKNIINMVNAGHIESATVYIARSQEVFDLIRNDLDVKPREWYQEIITSIRRSIASVDAIREDTTITHMPVSRKRLTLFLVNKFLELSSNNKTLIVAIDGADCSGKTTLANELMNMLIARGRRAIVIHGDDFINPRRIREKQGQKTAMGFYEDFWAFRTLIEKILIPIRQMQIVDFLLARINPWDDSVDTEIHYIINPSDIIIVEGVYLLRPDYQGLFDYIVHLNISEDLVIKRALIRDLSQYENTDIIRDLYEAQIIPAYKIYASECNPYERANIIVDNSIPENPIIDRIN